MNPQRRRQIGQVVMLVVLLVGLGFSVTYMMRTVNQRGSQRRPQPTPAPAAEVQPAAPEAAPDQPAAPTAAPPIEEPAVAAPEMNENLFKVFSLDPPKNPFIQEERWYEEELAEVPGYPELRDEGFFEGMAAIVPPFDELLDEGESWREAQLAKREQDQSYTVSGQSEDGMITTNLTLAGPPGETVDVKWEPGSGIPLTALSRPGWQQQYDLQPAGVPAGLPSGDDLFQPPGGLSIPGIDGVLAGGVVGGDQLACHGISGQGERATALVMFNDMPMMVGAGDSLPPRYQVDAVTADGVVLTELRDGDTVWLPISGQINGGGSTSNLPAPVRPSPSASPPSSTAGMTSG